MGFCGIFRLLRYIFHLGQNLLEMTEVLRNLERSQVSLKSGGTELVQWGLGHLGLWTVCSIPSRGFCPVWDTGLFSSASGSQQRAPLLPSVCVCPLFGRVHVCSPVPPTSSDRLCETEVGLPYSLLGSAHPAADVRGNSQRDRIRSQGTSARNWEFPFCPLSE